MIEVRDFEVSRECTKMPYFMAAGDSAMLQVLRDEKVRCGYRNPHIQVWRNCEPKTLRVVTRPKIYMTELWLPEDVTAEDASDWYISARLMTTDDGNPAYVEIWGYLARERVGQLPVKSVPLLKPEPHERRVRWATMPMLAALDGLLAVLDKVD